MGRPRAAAGPPSGWEDDRPGSSLAEQAVEEVDRLFELGGVDLFEDERAAGVLLAPEVEEFRVVECAGAGAGGRPLAAVVADVFAVGDRAGRADLGEELAEWL